MCDVHHLHVNEDPHTCVWHDSFTSMMSLIHVSDISHLHVCDITHLYMSRDDSHVLRDYARCGSEGNLLSAPHICDLTHPHVWSASFTYLT